MRSRRPAAPVVVLVVVALLVAAGALVVGLRGDEPADERRAAPGAAPAREPQPAFDLPSADELRASPRTAFAHYIPTFPLSFDDRPPSEDYYATQYLTPDGEQGKHAAYGGYLRDRPIGRPSRGTEDWRLEDLRTEVRQAVAAGLDGFTLDLLQVASPGGQWWDTSRLLLQAAAEVDPGFSIVLMPDLAALHDVDAGTLAASVAELAASPAAHRLDDGRLLVAPFLAEGRPASWWADFLRIMQEQHGTPVALLPVFLDLETHLDAFAPLSWGASEWGTRSPATNDPAAVGPGSPLQRIADVRARGLVWMQTVAAQDARPRSGTYEEAEATTTLRSTWQVAVQSGAELVQVATWNDYAESTAVAPSEQHGWSLLHLSSWYLAWWKTGTVPSVRRDHVVLTHRRQLVGALPTGGQTELMSLRPGSSPARDAAEAVVFTTAPARVRVRSGDGEAACDVPAGLSVCTVPLAPGTVSAELRRGDDVVASVVSPFAVQPQPVVQDLQYVSVERGRPALSLG